MRVCLRVCFAFPSLPPLPPLPSLLSLRPLPPLLSPLSPLSPITPISPPSPLRVRARVSLCACPCEHFTCACSDPYMDQVEALRPEVASLYRSDRARFDETAAEWTREYAAKKG